MYQGSVYKVTECLSPTSENIDAVSRRLFDDALEDFTEVELIRKRFEEWKFQFGDTYREAYIALCIPKLVNPFVRLQLISWNPLKVSVCVRIRRKIWTVTGEPR